MKEIHDVQSPVRKQEKEIRRDRRPACLSMYDAVRVFLTEVGEEADVSESHEGRAFYDDLDRLQSVVSAHVGLPRRVVFVAFRAFKGEVVGPRDLDARDAVHLELQDQVCARGKGKVYTCGLFASVLPRVRLV